MVDPPKIYELTDWLPTTPSEAERRGWDEVDVVLFSGDAYIDHPSFGPAVVGRIIESYGLRIALVPQPNWRDDLRDFRKFGRPRLFFGVTAGSMDSMVNHYTANRRLRSNDAYTPGNKAGFRPDYASVVYSQILKKLYPDVPVVMGGVEASLRRLTHYDYWSNKLRPGILADSGADLLVYGMGEQPLRDILRLLQKGVPFENLRNIRQTAFLAGEDEVDKIREKHNPIELHSHKQCLNDKKIFASNFKHIEQQSNSMQARYLIQKTGDRYIVVTPPYPTMTEKEMDASFDLPYTRMPHPRYKKRGPIPAWEMIKFSVNMHRGCFGGCSFCTISAHQGKFVANRSEKSIIKEVEKITRMPDFKGYISDLGGPSANMYKMQGIDLEECRTCLRPSCIHPKICPNLNIDHGPLLSVYRKARQVKGVKKAFVGSGIRYDMLVDKDLSEKDKTTAETYINELAKYHVSGRLKVAPEHSSDEVLRLMRKPSFKLFEVFKRKFEKASRKAGLNQEIIPYFISSHPGSKAEDMADLAIKTKEMGFRLEQIQDFTPTPMTVATVIYYSGYHPYSLKKVYTPVTKIEKLSQRDFFFWYKNEYKQRIRQTLKKAGREDLIKKLLGKGR
jgi:uncharacterized radical SAM protein YgiQ